MKYAILYIILSVLLMVAPINYMSENGCSEIMLYATGFGIALLSLLVVQILRLLNEIIDRIK